MKFLKSLTLVLTIVTLFLLPATTFTQRRAGTRASAPNAGQSSGEQEAAKFWSNYVASCGGSHYMRKAPGVFVELRGFRVQTKYDPLTEADRLNGLQAKGASWITASAHRFYSNSAWGRWGDGTYPDFTLVNSVRFQKSRGRWNFYGVGYFDRYAKTVTCSDVPGFRSSRMNESPTNSVQISDYHNFPIQSFIFWDSNTNVIADKFPKSTTTFVNWKITYTGTAFSYSLPPVEGHWYKDGVRWSEPNIAQFSNVGSGQLWAGKGWAEPGHWEVGSYTVKVYLRRQLIAQRSFEVVSDEALPGVLRHDGIYYKKYHDGTYWVLRFFSDGKVRDLYMTANDNFADILREAWKCTDDSVTRYYNFESYCKNFNMGQGTYSAQGAQIEFTTYGNRKFHRADGSSIGYTGSVTHSALNLRWNNRTRGDAGTDTYTYTRCPYRDC